MARRVLKAEVARKLAPWVRSSLRVVMPKVRTSDEDGMRALFLERQCYPGKSTRCWMATFVMHTQSRNNLARPPGIRDNPASPNADNGQPAIHNQLMSLSPLQVNNVHSRYTIYL